MRMTRTQEEILNDLIQTYPVLAPTRESIVNAFLLIGGTYERGGKLLIGGNGGSTADSAHIQGELMKGFMKKRPIPAGLAARLARIDKKRGEHLGSCLQMPLPAVDLMASVALSTAYLNDCDSTALLAQKILGYGRAGDTFLALSTSGNSENILEGVVMARAMGITVVGLSGRDGGELARMADVTILAPATKVYRIQELHLPIYHCLCLMLESCFFDE